MKEIFSGNVDINKTAYLNWRTHHHSHIENMIVISDGFMKSGIMLAEEVLRDNKDKKADIVIFPILYNVNHSIELYLKAITWELNILLQNDDKIEGQHNIKQILSIVISKYSSFQKNPEKRREFKDQFKNIEEYIEELFSLISNNQFKKDNMDFARYPFSKKYVNHFYIEEMNNVTVDLENFVNRFKDIHDTLDRLSRWFLYDMIEVMEEQL